MRIIPVAKNEPCDVAVVIGRWQIPHLGHDALFTQALALAPKVIVVIGSAHRARDTRNPFTASERQALILASLPAEVHSRLEFLPVRDYFDDIRWAVQVTAEVGKRTEHGARIGLVGFKKDATSNYLDLFPMWKSFAVPQTVALDATSLRNTYFSEAAMPVVAEVMAGWVKPGVLEYLKLWANLPAYRALVTEQAAIREYKAAWNAPVYLTADALVRIAGHVLLIRRGGVIGHGLWALPGGFLNPGEQFLPAALRELEEETGLGLPVPMLRSALKCSTVFDHPLRSQRGRLVTTAFYFAFGDAALPEVHAGDDASEARWVPIEDLADYVESMLEDHACILDHFIGIPGY